MRHICGETPRDDEEQEQLVEDGKENAQARVQRLVEQEDRRQRVRQSHPLVADYAYDLRRQERWCTFKLTVSFLSCCI
jgi:hypothetical protein